MFGGTSAVTGGGAGNGKEVVIRSIVGLTSNWASDGIFLPFVFRAASVRMLFTDPRKCIKFHGDRNAFVRPTGHIAAPKLSSAQSILPEAASDPYRTTQPLFR
jgi:hypothetical protein